MKLLRGCSILFALAAICILPAGGQAQVSINGPTCVATSTDYTYTISGNWNGSTWMTWCITGGYITTTFNSCASGTPLPQVHVTWTSSSGSVSLSTANGNASLNVSSSTTL